MCIYPKVRPATFADTTDKIYSFVPFAPDTVDVSYSLSPEQHKIIIHYSISLNPKPYETMAQSHRISTV